MKVWHQTGTRLIPNPVITSKCPAGSVLDAALTLNGFLPLMYGKYSKQTMSTSWLQATKIHKRAWERERERERGWGWVSTSIPWLIINHPLTHWGRDKMAATWADDIFKCNIVSEDVLTSIKISLNLVSKGRINNMPTLVQIIAWRRSADKPLSETINDGLVYWRIYASLGFSELTFWQQTRWVSLFARHFM